MPSRESVRERAAGALGIGKLRQLEGAGLKVVSAAHFEQLQTAAHRISRTLCKHANWTTAKCEVCSSKSRCQTRDLLFALWDIEGEVQR